MTEYPVIAARVDDPAGVNGSGKFEVEILGERRPAKLCTKPVFDPDGTRMRA
jgi:glycine cleavage system aminomethyltransferase T